MANITKDIGSNSRDYSTIAAWEADLDNGTIYSSGDIAVGYVWNDSPLSENSINVNGGGTIGLSAIKINVPPSQRHTGIASSGARLIMDGTGSGACIAINNSIDFWCQNLEINANLYTNYPSAIDFRNNKVAVVSHCIIHGLRGTSSINVCGGVVYINNTTGGTVVFHNNIVYNVHYGGSNTAGRFVGIYAGQNTAVNYANVFNNTVDNINTTAAAKVSRCFDGAYNSGLVKIVNNIGCNPASAGGGSTACYNFGASVFEDYNISSDATAGDTTYVRNVLITNYVVSIVNGSEDYRLKNSASAHNNGASTSSYANGTAYADTNMKYDVRNVDREEVAIATGNAWDIGAYEYMPYTNGVSRAVIIPTERKLPISKSITNPTMWRLQVDKSTIYPSEWLATPFLSATFNSEWTKYLIESTILPNEYKLALLKDIDFSIEFNIDISKSLIVPTEYKSGIARLLVFPIEWQGIGTFVGIDVDIPIEYLGAVNSPTNIPYSYASPIISEDILPIEYQTFVAAEKDVPIDYLAGLGRSVQMPTSNLGQVDLHLDLPTEIKSPITGSFVLPLDHILAILGASDISTEYALDVLQNVELPTDYRLALYSDRIIPTDTHQGINLNTEIPYAYVARIDSPVVFPFAFEGDGSAVTASAIIPIEFALDLNIGSIHPVDWTRNIAGERTLPYGFTQDITRSIIVPQSHLIDISIGRNIPISYQGRLYRHVNIPIEFYSGLVDSSRNIPYEYILGVSNTKILPIEAGGGILIDYQIPYAHMLEISKITQFAFDVRLGLILAYIIGYEHLLEVGIDKDIAFEALSALTSQNILPIEWFTDVDTSIEPSFVWNLESRGRIWVLDSRGKTWLFNERTRSWEVNERIDSWDLTTRNRNLRG